MPAQPKGEVPPRSGALPASALEFPEQRRLSAYVHVPYCRVRCGYCDFNTYTAKELGPGTDRAQYWSQIAQEISFSAEVLGAACRPLSTVFFGGGTPTLLPAGDLVRMLQSLDSTFGVNAGAEITTEANPDSVTPEYLQLLASGGFTRVSLGMQSAVDHVLATLDRTHDPRRIEQVVQWVKDAGMQVSLDLIYGTPGESMDDWKASVDAALWCEPDHISAYSLIIEPGTKMDAQVRRGKLPMPDEDDLADKYEFADAAFATAGFEWYEVSNWARSNQHRCKHNLAYWHGDDWWGYGPGAHSNINGVRFWNAKHPRAWAQHLVAGESPAVGREVLNAHTREVERILLLTRVKNGIDVSTLTPTGRTVCERFQAEGLLDAVFNPTLTGRLLVDYMVRELVDTL